MIHADCPLPGVNAGQINCPGSGSFLRSQNIPSEEQAMSVWLSHHTGDCGITLHLGMHRAHVQNHHLALVSASGLQTGIAYKDNSWASILFNDQHDHISAPQQICSPRLKRCGGNSG